MGESLSDMVTSANDDCADGSERRGHSRSVAVLKAAKLVCGREHLCLIRNISPAGLMADMHQPMPPGTPLVVLLTESLPQPGTVIWTRGETMGIRFDHEIDVTDVLAELIRAPQERRARLPRFDVDAWARLRVGARVFSIRLRNISQGGARIRIHGLNSPEPAVLSMNGFRSIEGVIRWCHGTHAGISFNQPLGLRQLMQSLHAMQPARTEAAGCVGREPLCD